jgi:hypothetical protein
VKLDPQAGLAVAPGVSGVPGYLRLAASGSAIAEQRSLNPAARFGDALAQSAVRCSTAANYESQWKLFSAFCAEAHEPKIPALPDLLSVEVIQAVESLVAGRLAERVLAGYVPGLAGDDAQDRRFLLVQGLVNHEVRAGCAKDDGTALWYAVRKWRSALTGAVTTVPSWGSSPPERRGTAAARGGPAAPTGYWICAQRKEGVILTARRGPRDGAKPPWSRSRKTFHLTRSTASCVYWVRVLMASSSQCGVWSFCRRRRAAFDPLTALARAVM